MKTKEKNEARSIRTKEQLSIKDIAIRLGVAKSSVSRWVRDLPLSKETIDARCLAGCIKGARVRHDDARAIRKQYQQAGMEMMDEYRDDSLFVAGCMMHWAEGAKDKNRVNISNTDSFFLRLWLEFIWQFFDIQPSDIALHIHCYLNNNKTQQQIESYWLKKLGLSKSNLRKTVVVTKHKFSTGAKNNRHPYGVAQLNICSTEVIQKIWGAVKCYASIDDNEKWLD
jgi:transcriptional regulator with XRE-family HTH domain